MKCKVCEVEKELYFFYLKNNGKPRALLCKTCYNIKYKANKDKRREYYLNNKEYFREKSKEWIMENQESRKQYQKDYHFNNREKLSEQTRNNYQKNVIHKREVKRQYYNKRIKNDTLFKLIKNTRSLISNSLKRKFTEKSKKTTEILGCSFNEFYCYLEGKFDENMNWDNQGWYWHLDHIKPISLANSESEIYELNHYTNFQPLYCKDNIKKSNYYETRC